MGAVVAREINIEHERKRFHAWAQSFGYTSFARDGQTYADSNVAKAWAAWKWSARNPGKVRTDWKGCPDT